MRIIFRKQVIGHSVAGRAWAKKQFHKIGFAVQFGILYHATMTDHLVRRKSIGRDTVQSRSPVILQDHC